MTFTPFATSRRSGAQPVLKRRLFRYAWMVLALAGAPALASASSPEEQMAQMRAECTRLHEDMNAMAKDGRDAMDDSSLSAEQRRTHQMCMSMPHDSGGEMQGEGRL